MIAPGNDPIPPNIIATRPFRVHQKPKNGVTCDSVDRIRNAAMAPKIPEKANANEVILFELTPIFFANSLSNETPLNKRP